MLKQCSLEQITDGKLTREHGHLVVCMHFYPRFLKKELRDDYFSKLAPDEKLLKEFNAMKEKLADHNAAFRVVRYEEKFKISAEALEDLKALAELAKIKDVYIACQCQIGERCHRDLLLLMAEHYFQALVEKPRYSYPDFVKRLVKGWVVAPKEIHT